MFMETNLTKTTLAIFFAILSSYAIANNETIKDLANADKLEKSFNSNNSNINLMELNDSTNPINEFVFFIENIVDKKKQLIKKTNFDNTGKNFSQFTNQSNLILDEGEFIIIKGVDNIEKLFNGSLIVSYKKALDLNDFARTYDVVFISDLSEINRGVFKVKNLFDLDSKIYQILEDGDVLRVELDTIDPSVQPE